MLAQVKLYLPLVIQKISTKHYSIFFSKLILHDQQLSIDQKNIRHYDYQCQGINNLQKFINRKINKNLLFSLQKLKQSHQSAQNKNKNTTQTQQQHHSQLQQKQSLHHIRNDHDISTTKSKNHLRFNTTMQQSDNSFIFSPNYKTKQKRFKKQICTQSTLTQPYNIDRSLILHNLLTKVKRINIQNAQNNQQQLKQSLLKPNKSHYFNVTLGQKCDKNNDKNNDKYDKNTLNNKTSLQTFQNYQNCCNCSNKSNKKSSKQFKRQKIIQKIQQIQQKISQQTINEQKISQQTINYTPNQYTTTNIYKPITITTPRSQYTNKYKQKDHKQYNQYKQKNQRMFTQTYQDKPDIIYVISKQDLNQLNNGRFINNVMTNAKSMLQFNHLKSNRKAGSYF